MKSIAAVLAGHEVKILLLILASFLALNFSTASLSPTVWKDEVMHVDPAARLAQGKGLTSTAWYYGEGEFYGGYGLIHAVFLAMWMKLWGISIWSARSLNYIYMALAVSAIWWSVGRQRLILSAAWRLLLVAIVLTSDGIVYAYRNGRCDTSGFLLASIGFFALGLRDARLRLPLLAVTGALLPLCYLQLVLWAALACSIDLLISHGKRLREYVFLGLGVIGGEAGYILWLNANGFLANYIGVYQFVHSTEPTMWFSRLTHSESLDASGILNPSAYLAIALLAICSLGGIGRRSVARSGISFAWSIAVFIPLVFLFLGGKFDRYYSWMLIAPFMVALLTAMSRLWRGMRLPLRVAATLLVAASLAPFPLRMLIAIYEAPLRSYGQVEQFVRRNIQAGDMVIADFPAYYALINSDATAYYAYYSFLSSDHRRVARDATLYIGRNLGLLRSRINPQGRWAVVDAIQPTGEKFPVGGSGRYYDLKAYRRMATDG